MRTRQIHDARKRQSRGAGRRAGLAQADRRDRNLSPSEAQPQTSATPSDGLRSPIEAPDSRTRAAPEPLCRRDQVSQLLARIEHARLDRALANADDIGDLFDRLAVVVDEVDHLA